MRTFNWKKMSTVFNSFWYPDKSARKLHQEIGEQRMIIKGLLQKTTDLESWVERYYQTLTDFTESISVMVWKKDAGHRYVLANQRHCNSFYGLEATGECLDSITGKTSLDILRSIERSRRPKNTLCEVCFISDEHVKKAGKPCHYFEAGMLDDKQILLYVIKTPEYNEKGEFIGTIGAGLDITAHGSWIIRQLNRWIYGGKVCALFHEENVFVYHIHLQVKQCDVFKSICQRALASGSGFCEYCSVEGGACAKNAEFQRGTNYE